MSSKDVLTTCLDAVQKTILSVGSGDGSQQEAIVKRGLRNIHVTFYDSKKLLLRKYPHAVNTLQFLEKECVHPLRFQVDATRIDGLFQAHSLDLIFFTFPHTGVPNNDPRNVQSNQTLLKNFLKAASKLLKPDGEVQITLKNGENYDRWQLPLLLEHRLNLRLKLRKEFDPKLFPGYKHRLTVGTAGALKTVPEGRGAKVYVFGTKEGTNQVFGTKEGTNQVKVMPFGGKTLTVLQRQAASWSDEELWAEVYSILERKSTPTTVLEIRRHFVDPKPDTRQFNRILYAKEAQSLIERFPPDGKSKKPRWKLIV